jgi:hypothetical protein
MNNLTVSNAKIPAHIAARIGKASALSTALASGLGAPEIPRISIKASRFRIREDGTETVLPDTTLEVVIVGANPKLSKTYYAKKWNPNEEPDGPDCFSLDGVRPDATATSPQNDFCASCPMNAWGSRVGDAGQKLKACADQKRLAIVAADDPEGTIYLLVVTPAALKGLNQYHKELSLRGIPPEVVRTRISFDEEASFPKLAFGFGGFLDEETQNVVDGLFSSDEVLKITGEMVEAPFTEPAKTASPALSALPPAKTKAKAAPAPVVEEEEEEVEEEVEEEEEEEEEEAPPPQPAKRFGKTKSAPAPVAEPKRVGRPPKTNKAASVQVSKGTVDDVAAQIAAMLESDD